ncbi:MAG TPA: O-antigen ligase family protein [Bryobacteraceae bacterium]|nr:O-antigen ligase family protein [Bryobacteraceae bacterium]
MFLVYLLIAVMPLSNHHFWGQEGEGGEMTMFKYLGGLCFIYACYYLAVRPAAPSLFRTWQARLFLVLYGIACISNFAHDAASVLHYSPLLKYTSMVLFFVVIAATIDSIERLRWALLTAVGSVAFASLYIIRDWQKMHSIYAGYRPGGISGDPNYFALTALLVMPFSYYMIAGKRPKWEKVYCFVCLLIMLIASALASSRGGLLGLTIASLYIVYRSKRRIRNILFIGGLVVPAMMVLPNSPVQRLLHPTYSDKGAEEARTIVWRAAWLMIQENPITGIGLGMFKGTVAQYETSKEIVHSLAHNSYIEIATELGIPALGVFVSILWFSYWTAESMRKRARRSDMVLVHDTALGIQAALLGSSIAIGFLTAQYEKLFWFDIFLSMSLPQIVTAVSRQARHERIPDEPGRPEAVDGGTSMEHEFTFAVPIDRRLGVDTRDLNEGPE